MTPPEAWPFLITRNKVLDYRVVIAPSFIMGEDASRSLINMTRGEVSEAGRSFYRELRAPSGEVFTVIFRVDRAVDEGKDYRDGFGRLVSVVIGFIMKGTIDTISVTEDNFQEIYSEIAQYLSDFRKETKDWKPKDSRPLHFPLITHPTALLQIVKLETYTDSRLTSSEQTKHPLALELEDVINCSQAVEATGISTKSGLAVMGAANLEIFDHYKTKKLLHRGSPLGDFQKFSAIAYSADGSHLAIAIVRYIREIFSTKVECELWLRGVDQESSQERILRVDSEICAVNFSPNGHYLACGGESGDIWLYDTVNKETTTYHSHKGKVNKILFSTNSRTLISASNDKKVNVLSLSLTDRQSLSFTTLGEHTGEVISVALTPDGMLLASGDINGNVRVWNMSGFTEMFSFNTKKLAVKFLHFIDNQLILVAGDRFIGFWDVRKRREIRCDLINFNIKEDIRSISIDRNGSHMVLGYKSSLISLIKIHKNHIPQG